MTRGVTALLVGMLARRAQGVELSFCLHYCCRKKSCSQHHLVSWIPAHPLPIKINRNSTKLLPASTGIISFSYRSVTHIRGLSVFRNIHSIPSTSHKRRSPPRNHSRPVAPSIWATDLATDAWSCTPVTCVKAMQKRNLRE